MKELYTIEEIVELAKVSRQTVYNKLKDKEELKIKEHGKILEVKVRKENIKCKIQLILIYKNQIITM